MGESKSQQEQLDTLLERSQAPGVALAVSVYETAEQVYLQTAAALPDDVELSHIAVSTSSR